MSWHTPVPIAPRGAAVPGALTALCRNPNQMDVFWVGPDGGVGTNYWHGGETVRLHLKVLDTPIRFSIDEMLSAMRETYAAIDLDVVVLSRETLSLPLLTDLDIGECKGDATAEQRGLFANRNNVGDGDIVVYFVRSTRPPYSGCATHPDDRPGCVVASKASRWSMAHEVGHVLGLDHAASTDRLMYKVSSKITNPPPDLDDQDRETMYDSDLTH